MKIKRFIMIFFGMLGLVMLLCSCNVKNSMVDNNVSVDNIIEDADEKDTEGNIYITCEIVFKTDWDQDGAIFNDLLFRLTHYGTCKVYSLIDHNKIYTFKLDKSDIISPHSNSVCFGSKYYDADDEFPLLYVNVYNNYANSDDKMEGICCVYRIFRVGDEFKNSLIQIIKIGFIDNLDLWRSLPENGDVRPYGNFVVNTDDDKLYAFVMRDRDSKTRFFEFDCPTLTDGEYNDKYGVNIITLTEEKIIDKFDCSYFKYMQGCAYRDGKIYSLESFDGKWNESPVLKVIDLDLKEEIITINLTLCKLHSEPEFIDFYGDVLYYGDIEGNIYSLDLKY